MYSPIVTLASIVTAMLVIMLSGCQHSPVFIPKTPGPDQGNDLTLVVGGCEHSLGRGVEICRVVEGSKITSKLTVIMPWKQGEMVSGTLKIRHGDQLRVVETNQSFYSREWSEIFGVETWGQQQEGPVQVSGVFKYKNGAHVETMRLLGYVYLIVLNKGYSPQPLYQAPYFSEATCRIYYSASGNSAMECQ